MVVGLYDVREWSLITGRGGGVQNRRGVGQVKFYPYKKKRGGGAGKVLAILKGVGGTTSFGVFHP